MNANWISTRVGIWIVMAVAALSAQEDTTVLKVLWMGGNNSSHNVSAQRDIFVPVLEDSGFVVTYRTDIDEVFNRDTLDNYDILLVWTGLKGSQAGLDDLTQQQDDDLVEWVEAGNAMVAVHAASSAWEQNDGYMNLVGGVFTSHGPGDLFSADMQPVETDHKAVEGIEPYDYLDEGRIHEMLRTDLDTLAFATQGNTEGIPWVWVHPQGEGRVYYTAGGHNTGSIETPEFQFQLIQAMRWTYYGDSIPVSLKRPQSLSQAVSKDLSMHMDKQGLRLSNPAGLSGHFDLLGANGELVVEGELEASGRVSTRAGHLKPGVYFYSLHSGKGTFQGRLHLKE